MLENIKNVQSYDLLSTSQEFGESPHRTDIYFLDRNRIFVIL